MQRLLTSASLHWFSRFPSFLTPGLKSCSKIPHTQSFTSGSASNGSQAKTMLHFKSVLGQEERETTTSWAVTVCRALCQAFHNGHRTWYSPEPWTGSIWKLGSKLFKITQLCQGKNVSSSYLSLFPSYFPCCLQWYLPLCSSTYFWKWTVMISNKKSSYYALIAYLCQITG